MISILLTISWHQSGQNQLFVISKLVYIQLFSISYPAISFHYKILSNLNNLDLAKSSNDL